MSWLPSAVSATPALASRSSRLMVTITDAGIPPTEGWSADLRSRAQASSSASWRRCMCGRWSGISTTVPSSSSIAVVRGFVNGSRIAFSWAPTVLLSRPARCHMPSRRCFSSRYRRSCCSWSSTGCGPSGSAALTTAWANRLQLRRRQDGGVVGEQLLGGLDRFRVEVVAGEVVHGPFHNGHFLRRSPHRRVAAPPVGAAQLPVSRRPWWYAVRPRRRHGPGPRRRRGRAVTPGSGIGSWWRSSTPPTDGGLRRRRSIGDR